MASPGGRSCDENQFGFVNTNQSEGREDKHGCIFKYPKKILIFKLLGWNLKDCRLV